jgi:SEC-C motif
MSKIPRNAQCTCGSGKKYKKCHGSFTNEENRQSINFSELLRRHDSDELIRIKQQGLGRPIGSWEHSNYKFVPTGNVVHWSKDWKNFTDFLLHYIKSLLGADWGNNEFSKPESARHPIIQWFKSFGHHSTLEKLPDGTEVRSSAMTGSVCCYLGLAYSLYLMKHNVELQDRLIARLKDIRQFQGAYYELIVANCLIRAGFELELENEQDPSRKHCEFAARSKKTGKRYWVEAKMRSVSGVMGKTKNDSSKGRDPTSRLTQHLSEALAKPASDERLIFIDLNTPVSETDKPSWLDKAAKRLEYRERDLRDGQQAYVIVTNMSFHLTPESVTLGRELFAHGLGICDFGKPGPIRLSDMFRQKKKHFDIHRVLDAMLVYPDLPETLDGQPASSAFGPKGKERIRIGETYNFTDVQEGGVVGKVTTATASLSEKVAYIGITTSNGEGMILTEPMTDEEIEDYKRYGEAYFGGTEMGNHEAKNIFELYEFFVKSYSKTPKGRLIELANAHPNIVQLKNLEHFDLLLEVCEFWVAPYAEHANVFQDIKS